MLADTSGPRSAPQVLQALAATACAADHTQYPGYSATAGDGNIADHVNRKYTPQDGRRVLRHSAMLTAMLTAYVS